MKHLSSISIVGLLGLTLSACLVNQDNATTRQRTTDNLRIYQSGDYLDYDVSGYDSSTPITGSLQVTYGSAALTDPTSNSTVTATRESSTLSMSIGGGSLIRQTVERYMSQDPTLGSMSIIAFPGAIANTYYWVTGSNINNGITVPTPVETMTSPLVVRTSNINFNVSACDTQTCNEFENMSEIQRVIGTEDKVTNIGKFNAFRVAYSNATLTKTGSPQDPFINVDLRHFCNSLGSTATGPINFSGTMWIVPEVGVIKYEMTCLSGSRTIQLNASLNNTNILLPN